MSADSRTLRVRCTGLEENGTFPLDNTGRGRDLSPAFILENLSPAAKTIAITLEDISHPLFRNFTHWVIYDLPASPQIVGAIPPGRRPPSLRGAVQGIAYGWHRYAGPKPPKGRQHRYRFTVYVLNCALGLSSWTTKKGFLQAAKGHILQRGTVTGIFG